MGGNDSPTPLKQADTPATAASTVEDAEEVLEPVLQKLAPREQEVVRHALAVSYRGPLPPSVEMGGYNREIPNGGDRIVKQWESEGAHRRKMEELALRGQLSRVSRGQWMAFLLVLIALASGTFLAMNNHDGLAAALFTTTIVAVLGAFITGKLTEPRRSSVNDDEPSDRKPPRQRPLKKASSRK